MLPYRWISREEARRNKLARAALEDQIRKQEREQQITERRLRRQFKPGTKWYLNEDGEIVEDKTAQD
jgi:hypothetical protein